MRKKKGENGLMVIKIDLEKAYDRLSWDFIRDTMVKVGLRSDWIRNIMACVESTRLSILWDGEQSNYWKPGRGIRQRDSMSPYLFVLCMERLSHMIMEEVREGRWKGIKVSRNGPTLSHLFFADDMVLFAEAEMRQIDVVLDCLNRFCNCSGQKVNLEKSQIHFSNNVTPFLAGQIANRAGIPLTEDLGRYLGVPSLHSKVKATTFSGVIEKVKKKLEGWKARHLSLAGRQVLAKSVLSTIPYYVMQSAKLPLGLCDDINKTIRQFIWGGTSSERRCSLAKWAKVTQPKERGGLGIRSARDMNMAFMVKLGWRLLREKESLWARVIINKYMGGNSDIENIKKKNGASNAWKGIVAGADILKRGWRRFPRNGRNTLFWTEPWLMEDPLKKYAKEDLDRLSLDSKVVDYWEKDRGWNWRKMEKVLPDHALRKLAGFTLVEDENCEDSICWREEPSGIISISSVYNMIHDNAGTHEDTIWKKIWKIKVPNKMRVFTWLILHKQVMCNEMRKRRGFTEDDTCHRC